MTARLEENTVENQEKTVPESVFTRRLVSLLLKQIEDDLNTGKIHSILEKVREAA